jgi:adenine-specific DNA-methyltransferase
MGSKRTMLLNGLGSLINQEINSSSRFIDLFSGSGAVAKYVAQNHDVPVLAYDLQKYSAVLTNAIIQRKSSFEWESIWEKWRAQAKQITRNKKAPILSKLTRKNIKTSREWCAQQDGWLITQAYGGHYFGPKQSIWLDAFHSSLPKNEPFKTVALASIIQAASQCAASPGHTAQPFQPTRSAKKYIEVSWNMNIEERIRNVFQTLSHEYAKKIGIASVADANEATENINENDLVFIDPPYSGVHYSRFYHVLETIARGVAGEVTGVGRYPAPEQRPRSRYSIKSESLKAIEELLYAVARKKARAIVTFPDHECSNGLSGKIVREIAGKYFTIKEQFVESKFSTLGGRSRKKAEGQEEKVRAARLNAKELILLLKPK